MYTVIQIEEMTGVNRQVIWKMARRGLIGRNIGTLLHPSYLFSREDAQFVTTKPLKNGRPKKK